MNISIGLCQCGCGRKTSISKDNDAFHGRTKGEPYKFVRGHNSSYRTGRTKHSNGNIQVLSHGHPRATKQGYVFEHILIAEKALGKHLPDKAVVHHHTPKQLVICHDQAYHLLLHRRKRAYESCGNANWRKCYICKQYDNPENLNLTGHSGYHRICMRDKRREEARIKKRIKLRNQCLTSSN